MFVRATCVRSSIASSTRSAMPADDERRDRERRQLPLERSPHDFHRSRLPDPGRMVAVWCDKCGAFGGRWIFHESRHECVFTRAERELRDALRREGVQQLEARRRIWHGDSL